jgi:hypothetical protein
VSDRSHGAWLAGLLLVVAPAPAAAQFTASQLVLAQAGERLYTTPRDRTSVYARLDLGWDDPRFALGLRIEGERTSDDSPTGGRAAGYDAVTQRWAEWRGARGRLRAGHLETVLGGGLLYRGFELPGVVLEEAGTRTRYAPVRDLDGLLAEAEFGPLGLRLLQGRPTDGSISPASERAGAPRRVGVIEGGQAEVSLPRSLRVGTAFARFAAGDAPDTHLGSGFVTADLATLLWRSGSPGSVPLRAEYAQRDAAASAFPRLRRDDDTPHALHASLGLLWLRWALVGEVKDYRGFRLGFNDSPALVREHAWVLLNRATHLLDAEGEEGFTLEASGPVTAGIDFVLHRARADGPPGFRLLRFEEDFAELAWAPAERPWSVRGHLARGADTWDAVSERRTRGLRGEWRGSGGWSGEAGFEHQRTVVRGFAGPARAHTDAVAVLGVTRAGWGTLGLEATRTTDPLDLPADLAGEPTARAAVFAGVTLAAELGADHAVQAFVGRRRGGRACVSGVCYEVASLEGAELRITSRFSRP